MLTGFSVLHTSAWLFLNKTDASLKWMEFNFLTEPMLKGDNAYVIGEVFGCNNLDEEAAKWYGRSYRLGNDQAGRKYLFLLKKLGRKEDLAITAEKQYREGNGPAVAHNYAANLVELGRAEEACAILEENIKEYPGYSRSYIFLLNTYAKSGNEDAIYRVLVQMEQDYKQSPEKFTQDLKRWLPNGQLDLYWGELAKLRKARAARR
ncbi:hypothetical protein AGMMS49965_00170 [Bacteroidia bacterium]|nr:hypothetical protein AGMMS49965_00170 [Bacteroidia bacterium]